MNRPAIISGFLVSIALCMTAVIAVAADRPAKQTPQLLALAKEIVACNQASGFVQAMSPAGILASKGRSIPPDLDPAAQAIIDGAAAKVRDLAQPVATNAFAERLVDDLSAEDIEAIAAFMQTDDAKAIAAAMANMALNPATHTNAPFLPDADFAQEIAAAAQQAGLQPPKNWQFPASVSK